jgi:hypothetical protein
MKRLQFMIEEDLDAALEREAIREGTSKAALIRRFLAERLRPLPPLDSDPLWGIVGAYDGEPGGVDEVVYG